MYKYLIFFALLSSCVNSNKKLELTDEIEEPHHFQLDCSILKDKEFVYNYAKEVIKDRSKEGIFDFFEIVENGNIFAEEDYFLSADQKHWMILVKGKSSTSIVDDNLLMFFKCADSLELVNAMPTLLPEIDKIVDLNNDGIKELVFLSDLLRQGEYHKRLDIVSFKDNDFNILYSAEGFSHIDTGWDDFDKYPKKGELLEEMPDWKLEKLDNGEHVIKEVIVRKYHNGGKTDEEILKKLIIKRDTTIININKFNKN
jgi:hypothetical protein